MSKLYNIECLKCDVLDTNGCCNKDGYIVFDGLQFTSEHEQILIHAPYTVKQEGTKLIFKDLFGNTAKVGVENTKYNTIAELIGFVKTCKCTSGGTLSTPKEILNIPCAAPIYTDLDVVDQDEFTIPAPAAGETIDPKSFLITVNGTARYLGAATHGYTYVINPDGSVTFTLSEHQGTTEDPCKVEIHYNVIKEVCIGG